MSRKRIDLPPQTVSQLISIFSSYPEIERVVVFGSRALGNAKSGSDIDCAFSGEKVTPQLVSRIRDYLEEETLLPYFFDCIHLESTQNENLLEHIKTHGITLYASNTETP
ncbi:putative nucleotidyltransferase [Desulfocapsa sulfexigens DSM 10523]|uniref:Putative nucleotidyltransferase n=1 Tax=Desulfocapsa sulfexigens (strain DSM 10523 / SB164P1) TaxID=1167006 RepID=M1PQW6_DESSD|nr:nucleotidyltransferase domain-containing protein [Desulfocapsa sulfexigens]AGF78791.1 putative nucleotidyltransferase [Desulfocapsa sulfexigens DSM 10523]